MQTGKSVPISSGRFFATVIDFPAVSIILYIGIEETSKMSLEPPAWLCFMHVGDNGCVVFGDTQPPVALGIEEYTVEGFGSFRLSVAKKEYSILCWNKERLIQTTPTLMAKVYHGCTFFVTNPYKKEDFPWFDEGVRQIAQMIKDSQDGLHPLVKPFVLAA